MMRVDPLTDVRNHCGRGSAGRASPCQGEGRGFESRRPLGEGLALGNPAGVDLLFGTGCTRDVSPGWESSTWWSGREARQRTANPCTRVQIPSPPRAVGAAVARFPDTEEVAGSNPVPPTRRRGPRCRAGKPGTEDLSHTAVSPPRRVRFAPPGGRSARVPERLAKWLTPTGQRVVERSRGFDIIADVAQLVEHHLAKVRVAGSNPVVRSERVPPPGADSYALHRASPSCGGVAERRGNGLQIRARGFKSRLHLGRLAQR